MTITKAAGATPPPDELRNSIVNNVLAAAAARDYPPLRWAAGAGGVIEGRRDWEAACRVAGEFELSLLWKTLNRHSAAATRAAMLTRGGGDEAA